MDLTQQYCILTKFAFATLWTVYSGLETCEQSLIRSRTIIPFAMAPIAYSLLLFLRARGIDSTWICDRIESPFVEAEAISYNSYIPGASEALS